MREKYSKRLDEIREKWYDYTMANDIEINEKIADTAVDGYKKIENAVVGGYTKIEDKFVEKYLAKDGETVEEAKERLKNENK